MDPYALNLGHLRAIVVIRGIGSLTMAARTVGLSQPALTQGLSKLENRLGAMLFERGPNGVTAMASGTALCDRVERAFAHLATATLVPSRGPRGFARPDRLMTGSQLRALLALADTGSFVGASAATGLSQPALHRAVRELEQVLGVVLVERRGRGVALAAAGRQLARGARLAAAELAAGIAEATGGLAEQTVAVGTMPLARARVLPVALARFVSEQPHARVRVVEGSWRDLAEPLRDGSLDMMIGAMRDQPPPDFEQEPLFDDVVAIIGRASHPLVGQSPGIDDLARFGWVVSGPGTPVRARWEELFAGRPLPTAPVECGSTMVTRGVLAATDLLALLSPDQVSVEIAGGMLACIAGPLPEATRRIGLITRTGWRPTGTHTAFIAALRNAGASRLSENL